MNTKNFTPFHCELCSFGKKDEDDSYICGCDENPNSAICKMKFTLSFPTPDDMLDYLTCVGDLYNKNTETFACYRFGVLQLYDVESKKAVRLKSYTTMNNNMSWKEYLSDNSIRPVSPIIWCKENYNIQGWTTC